MSSAETPEESLIEIDKMSVDQLAGAFVLIMGAIGSLLLVIWQSKCRCSCRIGLSDTCYIFDCTREPPTTEELKTLADETKALKKQEKSNKKVLKKENDILKKEDDILKEVEEQKQSISSYNKQNSFSTVSLEPEPEPEIDRLV